MIDSTNSGAIVIGVFVHIRAYSEQGGMLPPKPRALLEDLLEKGRMPVVLSFGNPYPMAEVKGLGSYLCAFGDADVSIEAAVRALCGEIPARGSAPPSLGTRS